MKPISFTDDDTGAVYTVRAMNEGEDQEVINITVAILQQLAALKGWEIADDMKAQYAGYPAAIQTKVHEFVALWQCTTIVGTPGHPFPDSVLDMIDTVPVQAWLKFLRQYPALKNQWTTAWNTANREETDPQLKSGDASAEIN
ncbi:MAG: hypothetical protein ACPG7F_09885 [Aggregatilineales bacterium]